MLAPGEPTPGLTALDAAAWTPRWVLFDKAPTSLRWTAACTAVKQFQPPVHFTITTLP
jgi:hypothetical protein